MNLQNRSIYCRDNIDILRGIDSDSVDLIYLDPPFNKKKEFTAPIGSSAEGASFLDIFRMEDVKEEWLLEIAEDHHQVTQFLDAVKTIEGRTSYNFCYLAYMAIRLIEMYRILKNSGSLYLHCDPTMSHYLKLLLDCVFGERNFRNEVIWFYRKFGQGGRNYKKNHDILLYYSKDSRLAVYNPQFEGFSPKTQKDKYKRVLVDGKWKQDKSTRMEDIRKVDGVAKGNVWEISFIHSQSKERTGYPTQKPLALLEQIISASSNVGDMVLDPFCGCATSCIAAEKLGRQWVGVDVSIKAYDLVRERLGKEVARKGELFTKEIYFSTDPPQRSDIGADSRRTKYVYIIANDKFPGEYKVGIASNVESRLSSYNTGDPDRGYRLEYKYETPHFRAIEAYIHEKYDNKHEWVSGDVVAIARDIESWSPPSDSEGDGADTSADEEMNASG